MGAKERKNITSADRAKSYCQHRDDWISKVLMYGHAIKYKCQKGESKPSQRPPAQPLPRLSSPTTDVKASKPVVTDRQRADSPDRSWMVPRFPSRVPRTVSQKLDVRLPSSTTPPPVETKEDETDLFTTGALYTHSEPMEALMWPDGGLTAVKLHYKLGSKGSEWCSARCISTEQVHYNVEYVIHKVSSESNFRLWFKQQKCTGCKKYLARMISPSMLIKEGFVPPRSEGEWKVPVWASKLWEASFMTSIVHY